jgi:chemotaxis regulatin CheY-phosphate phosphatase CheZ
LKLSLGIDLTPFREQAKAAVTARLIQPENPIHRLKVEEARKESSPLIQEEASLRGMSVEQLRQAILDKAREAEARMIASETRRQRLLAQITAAQSEQELNQIKQGLFD